MHNKLLSILAVSIALIGCGGAEEGGSESHAPDTLQVSVTDTIGVMAGDTALVFGKITDATFTRDGDLYILDGLQGCIRTFSGEGEYLGTAGRIGSGPGEYQYPRSFSYQSSGGLVVCDWGGISVTYLTSDLEFDTLLTGFRHIAPDRIVPSLNETCVGMTLEYSMEDDRPSGETQIARFGRDTEPEMIYCSYPMTFTVDDDGDLNVHTVNLTWDTGPDGSVAIAPRNDSTWSFMKLSFSGDTLFTVEREWERVPKSEEELEEGIVHESLSTSTESGNSVNRDRMLENIPRYRNAISSIEIDDEGRIWVAQGWTDMPVFEVFDEGGEPLFVAVIPQLSGVRSLGYSFENGFLAYDEEPADYPKVYLLAVDES